MDTNDIKALAQQRLNSMGNLTNRDLLKMLWDRDFSELKITEDEERKLIGKGISNLQYRCNLSDVAYKAASKEIAKLRQVEIAFSASKIPANGHLAGK